MDKDVHNRLADLKNRLKDLDEDTPEEKPKTLHVRTTELSLGIRVATELAAGVLVGAFLGWVLDTMFAALGYPTRPFMMILWLFFGAAAGLKRTIELARQTSRISGQDVKTTQEETEILSEDDKISK